MAPATPRSLRNRIIELKADGHKQPYIVNALGISRMTVHRILKMYETKGSVVKQAKKKSFTFRDKNRLRRIIKKHRNGTVREIADSFNQGLEKKRCISFIFKQIKLLGASQVVQKKQMIIRKYNELRRRIWVRQRKSWNFLNWRKFIFSDECKVEVNTIKKQLVWKFKSDPGWLGPQKKKSKRIFSVMIWGCVTFHGFRKLEKVNGNLNSEKYMGILERNLPAVINSFQGDDYIFQQDNAPCHVSNSMMQFFAEKGFLTTTWPPQSPDINIIENLWKMLKKSLKDTNIEFRSRDELYAEIEKHWNLIAQNVIGKLYDSLPRRMTEVLKMRGQITKY